MVGKVIRFKPSNGAEFPHGVVAFDEKVPVPQNFNSKNESKPYCLIFPLYSNMQI